MRRQLLLKAFALAMICLVGSLCTSMAWSQATSTGSVSGQVTDQSGAAVPGASVVLRDTGTGNEIKATSNAAGRFVIVNVPSGNYILAVSHEGFSQEQITDVIMTVGATLTVNAQLKVGKTSETVTVEAHVLTELQTTNATVGNTIDSKSIQLLPNLGRDVSTLAAMQPAVNGAGYTAGSNYDQNTYHLDGGNITDDMGGQTISYQQNMTGTGGTQQNGYASGVIPTPIESIEEMKVSVAGQGIDFNNSAGADVQMVTKRGTNAFHGALYEYYFDTALGSANSWANNHTADAVTGTPYTPIVSNHRNRYGFAVGGPVIKKKIMGGSTYFFVNYEALRFPNLSNFERPVPSATLDHGVIQIANAAGTYIPYNLGPLPVTTPLCAPGVGCGAPVVVAPAVCPGGPCDPRGIGISPEVATIWNKFMPAANDYSGASGDTYNTAGYLSAIRQTETSNYWVGRIDHDFGDKNRFFMSYRYFGFQFLTSNQNDIGGGLPGDTNGIPAATAPRPQKPSFLVFGLTSNLSSNITNDLRVAYTRTWWQYADESPLQNPLIAGEGGAPEIGGESATALIPYNVNTQSTRTRFWDGQDKQLSDSLSMIKGNHLFQFGGSYQRDFDYHSRNDNGLTIDVNPTYLISTGAIQFPATLIPSAVPASQNSTYETLYSETLGMISQSQVTYSRTGSNLNINPLGTPAFDQSVIPYYNVYWGDTWHLKPNLTFVYGLAYAIEMPPYEINGKQINLVDANGQELSAANYLAAKQNAALQGINYNPQVGYALVGNIGSGLKYPYNPDYGEFSPRLAVAWNPTFTDGILGKILGSGKTVIRAGYSRIYGRLNGVDQVLVPLLGPGFLQGVACTSVLSNGTCGTSAGTVPTPSNVFRFGPDGLVAPLAAPTPTLPQPYFPGTAIAGTSTLYPNAGDVDTLDPNFKPSRTDNLTVSVQRQISNRMNVEFGYIGKISKNDFQEINLDAVPTMFTLGGQTFASAYASLYSQVCNLNSPTCAYSPSSVPTTATITAQPFFEAALGGTSSAYCKGYSSCTAAILESSTSNLSALKSNAVATIWANLNNASSWVPGKTTMDELGQLNSASLSTSLGYSNYNALYVSFRAADWHGITVQSNFTWGRALGTAGLAQLNSGNTALDPWNMQSNYGPQSFDVPIEFNFLAYYQPQYFKNNHGPLGWVLGGWTIAPLFTAQSGNPTSVGSTSGDSFGETASTSSSVSSTADGNAVSLGGAPYTGTNSRLLGVGSSGCTTCLTSTTVGVFTPATVNIGTNNPTGMGMYANPGLIYSEFRPCVLGVETNCGGYVGSIRSEPVWNLDATIAKNFDILKENRLGASVIFQITNVFNHMQPGGPSASLTGTTTFGRITSQGNTPRNMEFGIRLHF